MTFFEKKYLRAVFILFGIAVFLFFIFVNPFHLSAGGKNVTAVAVLMVIWWVTEVLPMPVVALLPIIFFPILNILPIDQTVKSYSNPVIFLFMGGFMIGLAIEKWNLHKRIALSIVKITGTSGNRIILGFILASGFLSMWLSNTATTMMMFPIALSVIHVMKGSSLSEKGFENFSLSLMLVIAFASNFGGISTIIGTPPNVAFIGYINKKYEYNITFSDWMKVAAPVAILLMFSMYFVLTRIMFPNRIKSNQQTGEFIKAELANLGKLSVAEKRVLSVFIATAFLWIFKSFIVVQTGLNLNDDIIAIIGASLLFFLPSGSVVDGKAEMLLEWKDTQKMAWGILILFGGGIALASGMEDKGIITQMGEWMAGFSKQGGLILVFVITVVCLFMSELMSNVAQVIVLAPVMSAMADAIGMDPLLLGIPMTLAASCASMLPMGTPPNAIVFSSGYIKLPQMLKAGFVLNIISVLLITLFCWYVLPNVMHVLKH